MRTPLLALSTLVAALALGGCNRTGSDPATTTPPGELPADTTAPVPDDGTVSMRYSCGDGYRVAIMGDVARVATVDGRQIDLQRVADSSPPLYAGEALEFAIGSQDAQLAQDEGAHWTCTPD